MPNTYTLLETITVGAAGASSVTFNSIPQTGYTDLVIKVSGRSARAGQQVDNLFMTLNGTTTNFTTKLLQGNGTAASSSNYAIRYASLAVDAAGSTANTFSSHEIYIPNYTSANYKSYSVDSVSETNATGAQSDLVAGLWSNTAAITTILLQPEVSTWVQHSTFTLYGVSALGVTPTKAPKATGGSIIQTDGTYWYHAFLSSGTFTPATALSCDVLVVAGGGGGGGAINFGTAAAGGGAGGYRSETLSLSTTTNVTIGAGGAGGVKLVGYPGNNGTSGGDSTISTITSAGGGYGSGYANTPAAGGSGGGGAANGSAGAAGNTPSTSPAQGFAGGSAVSGNTNAAGGGGAGAVGANSTSNTVSGAGGAGSNAHSTWLSTVGLGVSGYLAGGGGGGNGAASGSDTPGAGGSGGGGKGGEYNSPAVVGTPNTGSGGGGGGWSNDSPLSNGADGQAGGSGLVIIRYLAA